MDPIDPRSFRSNIAKYYAYAGAQSFFIGLGNSVWVILLQRLHHWNLTQIMLTDTIFYVAGLTFEVPTGIVADRYGRRTSLVLGCLLFVVYAVGFITAPTFLLFAIASLIGGLAITFFSGAGDALLFESCKLCQRSGDYTRCAGRSRAVGLAALAAGSLLGGTLAARDIRLPFVIAGAGIFLSSGIVLSMRETLNSGAERLQERTPYRAILHESLVTLRRSPVILVLLLCSVFQGSLTSVTGSLLHPYSIAIGLPLAALGVVSVCTSLAGAAGSMAAGGVRARFGNQAIYASAAPVLAVLLALMGVLGSFPSLGFGAAIYFVVGISQPVLLSLMQDRVPDKARATLLSFGSMLNYTYLAAFEPAMGAVADRYSIPTVFLACAALGCLFSLVPLIARPQAADNQSAPRI